jgi:hypothetical protein
MLREGYCLYSSIELQHSLQLQANTCGAHEKIGAITCHRSGTRFSGAVTGAASVHLKNNASLRATKRHRQYKAHTLIGTSNFSMLKEREKKLDGAQLQQPSKGQHNIPKCKYENLSIRTAQEQLLKIRRKFNV